MGELDPRIREFFGNDEHPEESWGYLHPADKAWIKRIALAGGEDPGVLSTAELRTLGPDAQRRRQLQLEDWYKAWPYARTGQLKALERHIGTLPRPRPQFDDELLDVPLITGPPGTGKTFILKRQAVLALCLAARDRRLEIESRGPAFSRPLIDPDWRPVVFHSTDGNPSVKAFFKDLCEKLSVPPGPEPQAAFRLAVLRHGVQTVAIDEVQMINFDGQKGMYIHNAIKALQNMNVRVILAGHNVRSKFERRKTAAQNATQTQSIARWAFLDLSRYAHRTEAEIIEWRSLLRTLESHLRLAGHEPDEPVLSKTFEQHLWVTTLGYMNHLAALLNGVCLTGAQTTRQVITAEIIDSIQLAERARPGRAERLRAWRAGTFDWTMDFALEPWAEQDEPQ